MPCRHWNSVIGHAPVGGHAGDAGEGVGVVGGELGVDPVSGGASGRRRPGREVGGTLRVNTG